MMKKFKLAPLVLTLSLLSPMAFGQAAMEQIIAAKISPIDLIKAQKLIAANPELKAKCERLAFLITTTPQDQEAIEKEFFDIIFALESQGQLKNGLAYTITTVKAKKKIAVLEAMDSQVLIEQLYHMLKSELLARGYYPGFKFESWEKIASDQEKRLKSYPKVAKYSGKEFQSIFKKITGSQFHSFEKLELLSGNSVALEKRLELIKNSTKQIDLMTWGYYDDDFGKEVADALIEAHKERNIQVNILIDYQTASRPGYDKELARMKAEGLNVVGWIGKENKYYGMHMKMMIVDNSKVIEGGRNIAKYYLDDSEWEDLDVYIEGGTLATIENPNHFASFWNEQIKAQKLKLPKLEIKKSAPVVSGGSVATIVHKPQVGQPDKIYEMTLYAIENAKKEITIANAYFINTPAITSALERSLKRGVKVNIYTNSNSSVDEPIVSLPIMKSAKHMAEKGAKVYLKVGKTLHTKMFIADDLAWVGSYNLHPRSLRYENEKVTITTNPQLIKSLKSNFKQSIDVAFPIKDPAALNLPNDPNMEILFGIIYNQL